MERRLVISKDKSHTIFVPELNAHYHSTHGAIQEAIHIFINSGLLFKGQEKSQLNILEFGFGSGLNALLTAINSKGHSLNVHYTTLEKYPLSKPEWQQLNYVEHLSPSDAAELFRALHECPWSEKCEINPGFTIQKQQLDFRQFKSDEKYDLVYYDAFGPETQPDLWNEEIFENIYNHLKPGGFLITYCVKGTVRRNMKAAGFEVEKLPGPPGKREIARAIKISK